MTLSPNQDRNTIGVDGPKYDLNQRCPVPGCDQPGRLQRHHMWRKSDTIGDHWWVKTDDRVVGNCINICAFHHTMLTDNVAKITFDGLVFCWKDPMMEALALAWQPPLQIEGLESLEPEQHRHDQVGPGEVCPTCYRKVPLPREKVEGPKLRKTWCVAVPEDRWEDGADVLGTLLEEARRDMANAGLPYGEEDTVKYHILAAALGLFVQFSDKILSDG
jgi:hypothetical protein